MKTFHLFLLGSLVAVLSSCSQIQFRPLLAQTLILPASDFGPAALSAPLLGENAEQKNAVVYLGMSEKALKSRYPEPQHCYVPVVKGIKHLNRNVAELPHDAAHAELRGRLVATRSRLLEYYDTRRIAFNSVPPYNGRGFMTRRALMPPLGTTR